MVLDHKKVLVPPSNKGKNLPAHTQICHANRFTQSICTTVGQIAPDSSPSQHRSLAMRSGSPPAMGYGSKFISERLDLLTQENGDRLNFSQMSKPTTMSP